MFLVPTQSVGAHRSAAFRTTQSVGVSRSHAERGNEGEKTEKSLAALILASARPSPIAIVRPLFYQTAVVGRFSHPERTLSEDFSNCGTGDQRLAEFALTRGTMD